MSRHDDNEDRTSKCCNCRLKWYDCECGNEEADTEYELQKDGHYDD